MDIENLIVRSYQPADREVLFQIAADAAFSGEPEETFIEEGICGLRLKTWQQT